MCRSVQLYVHLYAAVCKCQYILPQSAILRTSLGNYRIVHTCLRFRYSRDSSTGFYRAQLIRFEMQVRKNDNNDNNDNKDNNDTYDTKIIMIIITMILPGEW